MKQSESIGELAKALSAAQGEIKPPKKDKTGKIKGTTKAGKDYEYEYKYSDLADLIDCVRAPFAKHGLAFTQTTRVEDAFLIVETMLMHASGQWKVSEYPIPHTNKPQELGSLLTYGKRYALSGMFGIAAEHDDDGAFAQRAAESRRDSAPERRQQADKASGLNADILDVAQSIEMAFGGNVDELVGRASAFPKDKADKEAGKRLDEQRWTAPRSIVLAPHNMYIKDASKLPSSEKWKQGTLARLLARRDALRAEPTDLEMEGRDAEAEAMQAQFDETPF